MSQPPGNTPLRRLVALSLAAFLAGLLVTAVACGGDTKTAEKSAQTDKVSLQLNWFHEAEFIGYYVADAKGFYAANGLTVEIREGGPGDAAIGHVFDRSVDFAVSSFGEQRDAVTAGKPSVAVMAAFQIPPLVIFSPADAGIHKPADLAGRRVGVTTDYWAGVLDQTLEAAGVDPAKVEQVAVKAEDLQPLYDGKVDAWLGYAQAEPIQAEMAGHAVTNIFPADYGVGGYEGLLLANTKTVAGDPDLVERFVQASQQGWRYAVEHPDEAAQILLKWAPDPGLEFQKLSVRAVGPLVDTPQSPIGGIDADRWQQLMGDAYQAGSPGYTAEFLSTEP